VHIEDKKVVPTKVPVVEVKNETIPEDKNETKKEVVLPDAVANWNNTAPRFLSNLPTEIVFDLDMGLESYYYISPIANDTEGDKITMDFKGVEGITWLVIRKKKDNSFLLIVEETLIEPSQLGTYQIQVLLSDKHTKTPLIH